MEKIQTNHIREDKKLKLIHGNPPVHGFWKFSDPPVGPMENAQKVKNLDSFLTMGKMYSNMPRINHLGI